MRTTDVIGRDAELARTVAFLDALPAGASGLVIEGEAGAGKTTLWLAGVEEARERGYRVLETRPVEAEASLPFAGLGDLVGSVVDEVLDEVPEPQGDALRVALLLAPPRGVPPDERAVAVALLGAVRVLVRSGPVLIAVDDVQWLDPPSATVVTFAWRRLRGEPVGLLLAHRIGTQVPARLVDDARLSPLAVGPLTLGAVHRLLHERLGLVLSRPALRRVHEVAGGNPFFALELGRTLQRHEAGKPIPVGDRPLAVAVGEGSVWAFNSLAGTVIRIDPKSGKVLSESPRLVGRTGTPDFAGLAVVEGSVWVSSPSEGTVVRLDVATNRPDEPIRVGAGPFGLAVADGAVWVANYDDGTVTRIDARTGKVVGAITVGGQPIAVTVGDDGAVWVANAAGQLAQIDPESDAVVGEPVKVGSRPQGVAAGEGAVWVVNQFDNTLSRVEM